MQKVFPISKKKPEIKSTITLKKGLPFTTYKTSKQTSLIVACIPINLITYCGSHTQNTSLPNWFRPSGPNSGRLQTGHLGHSLNCTNRLRFRMLLSWIQDRILINRYLGLNSTKPLKWSTTSSYASNPLSTISIILQTDQVQAILWLNNQTGRVVSIRSS